MSEGTGGKEKTTTNSSSKIESQAQFSSSTAISTLSSPSKHQKQTEQGGDKEKIPDRSASNLHPQEFRTIVYVKEDNKVGNINVVLHAFNAFYSCLLHVNGGEFVNGGSPTLSEFETKKRRNACNLSVALDES